MILLAAAALAVDLSLLRPVTDEAYSAEPFSAPFVSVFQRGSKRLVFVSGDHGHGKDSAVAKTIRAAFGAHRPQAVVVEGVDPAYIERHHEYAARRLREEPERVAESEIAADLAHRAGVPCFTGELRDREEFEALRRAGFTIEDYVFYYMAASIPSWRKDGRLGSPDFRARAAEYMSGNARSAGVDRRFSYEDFERWYAAKARLAKPPEELSYNDGGPHPGPGRNHLQSIAWARDLPRERRIALVVEGLLNRHDRVMIVYGSGHLVKQRKLWERLLGPSKDSKPY